MSSRKLNGPLGGDYVSDGAGNAIPVNAYPVDADDQYIDSRLATAEAVQTSQKWGLVAPNPGTNRLIAVPSVMSSPPTVTIGTAGAGTVISNSVLVSWTDSAFRYYGGSPAVAGAAYPDTLMGVYSITTSAQPHLIDVEFEFDGSEFEIYQKALASNTYRLWVDGQPATADPQSGPGTPGSLFLTHVDFGSRANRRIRIEGTIFYFGGVRIGPNDTIWESSHPIGPRVSLISDSFGEGAGTGGSGALDTFVKIAGRMLGWRDIWSDAVGGTGYLNNGGGGGKTTYRGRVSADVIANEPDIVIVHGSVNDDGQSTSALTTEAATLYSTIRSGLPNVFLIVVLPFPMLAASTYDTERDAIRTAADASADLVIDPRADGWITGTGRVGSTSGTGNADLYRSSDQTHPTKAGQVYLGWRLAQAISAAMPILGS